MTLLCCVFFYFHNFEYQGSINVSVKFITNYMVPEKKLILVVLLFLVMAAILDS